MDASKAIIKILVAMITAGALIAAAIVTGLFGLLPKSSSSSDTQQANIGNSISNTININVQMPTSGAAPTLVSKPAQPIPTTSLSPATTQERPTTTSLPPAPTPSAILIPSTATPKAESAKEIIVLANSEDNIYSWGGGSPYITTKFVNEGDIAFIPTGNNYFQKDFGVIGYEANETRYITLKLCQRKIDPHDCATPQVRA